MAVFRGICMLWVMALVSHPFIPLLGQENVNPANYLLVKPASSQFLNYSGDNQHQRVGLRTDRPIKARVIDQTGNPVANHPVRFEVSSAPGKARAYQLENHRVTTDASGIAQTYFIVGDKPGSYIISARIEGMHRSTLQLFMLHARDPRWVILLIMGLIGGLALFLVGLQSMSQGLQQAAGDRMRSLLSKITNNRFIAVGVGAFITMLIQSSSATSVMLVSFVQAGLMKFTQTLGIILGADIGTTVTAQLIAFKITDYALLMIGAGLLMEMLLKKETGKYLGKAVMGFGLLFFGMHIMSESMYPLRSYDPFIQTLLKLENPMLGILAGMIFTALVQSSSAFIGIVIVLSTQGLLTLEAAIPMLLGANVGTAITAILASINTSREAQRVALAHTLFKVLGVVAIVWWIGPFARLTEWMSPGPPPGAEGTALLAAVVPRQIANAHTLFNLTLTLLVLPFTNLFARFIYWIIPEKPAAAIKPRRNRYLKKMLLSSPSLALNMSKEEAIRMMETVKEMAELIPAVFLERSRNKLEIIARKEERVNSMRTDMQEFLVRITRENVLETRIKEAFQIMYALKEFEQMADVVSVTLYRKALVWLETDLKFSGEGEKEIREYHQKTIRQISKAIEVFTEVNLEEARAMKGRYKEYRQTAIELERQHYFRLREQVPESVRTSEFHLELISAMKIISGHATNVARILLQWTESETEQ